MSLNFSFDIGHSSIGWSVLSSSNKSVPHPTIVGTGVVTFPPDDCLASKRRDLRRVRRNIRSTRQRIERLKKWLLYQGFLTRDDLDLPGHPAPFLLAASALKGVRTLTPLELWHTLRWYAHNRGYDGNSRWSRQEEDSQDTEKVRNAQKKLNDLGTSTMAETVCQLLELKPSEVDKKISSYLPYKTLNTAYPRHLITAEVKRLLNLHQDTLPGLDQLTSDLIFHDRDLTKEERATLSKADIKLPKRYHGGLLFGQLVPRFDNRIISRCPITWAGIYRREIAAGTPEKEAFRLAERDSKVPTKKSLEFREYRLARILANLKANGQTISAKARQEIFQLAHNKGRLTSKDLDQLIESHHPGAETNVHAYFQLHPDSKDALIFDPVMHEFQKAKGSRAKLSPFWKFLPASSETDAFVLLQNGHSISLQWIVEQVQGNDHENELHTEIEKAFKKGKKDYADLEDFCQRTKIRVQWPSGRAPYARPILKKITTEILAGFDATKSSQANDREKGEDKPENGILYELSVPDSEVNQLLQKRPLDKLTNNPLIRHRLLILERLLEELITEFAPNNEQDITEITVEVAREVKELSGKSAKEISSELNNRLKDFKSAVTHLKKHAPTLPITGGLIRKCRIAMDLDWTCPFTGDRYDAHNLPRLELEHIIPFSARKTNALHALVLTWPEINRWKSNRTARQFILDEGGKPVPDREKLSIKAERPYLDFVRKLKIRGHDDDRKRQSIRKSLLEITTFEEKEQGFTDGALTQSSHLIKLAMRGLSRRLPKAKLRSIPGIATAEIRRSWDLLSCLGHPDVCEHEAMRWLEKRDRLTGALITEGFVKFPSLKSAPLVEKKKKGKVHHIPHPSSFPCPNDECEQFLMWPEDTNTSETHCPYCHAHLKRIPKPKDEIRSLTHLHHSLDALTIGLIAYYFPITKFGQNQSGKIWKALVSRSRNHEEKAILRSTGLFHEHERPNKRNPEKSQFDFKLKKLDPKVKTQVTKHLASGRVVQHIPADRSGTKSELTTWAIIDCNDTHCVILQRQNRSSLELIEVNGRPQWKNQTPSKKTLELLELYRSQLTFRQQTLVKRGILKLVVERLPKILGPNPTRKNSKLQPHGKGRGAIVIEENFGIALDPKPALIPFHKVNHTLSQLKKANHGNALRIIRKGTIIRVQKGTWKGTWKVISTKESDAYGISVDLTAPSSLKLAKGNARIIQMIKDGLEIIPVSLSGRFKPQ